MKKLFYLLFAVLLFLPVSIQAAGNITPGTDHLYQIENKRIYIGGKDVGNFSPTVSAGFDFDSGKEVSSFSISRTGIAAIGRNESFVDGKLHLVNGNETDIWEVDPDTGFIKWDIELAEKPASDVWEWSFTCTPDIQFYYQPALTPEEIADGVNRPDNIVGSYAVYVEHTGNYLDHNGKTIINYRNGKIAHILRPLIIDAAGPTEWAELYIEKTTPTTGIIRITASRPFLNSCTYPGTIIDPTFGNSTDPGSDRAVSNCEAIIYTGTTYTASTGDTITKYTLNSRNVATLDLIAYTFSGGVPVSRLNTPETVTSNVARIWRDIDSGSCNHPLSNGVTYCVAFGNETSSIRVGYDTGSAGDSSFDDGTTLDATWSESTTTTWRWGMYATYTAGAGGATLVHPIRRFLGNGYGN